jgi:hypothetical protein
MIVDGRGDAEVRCWESRQDRRPGEFKESSACELACRVHESLFYPSACFCEDLLQLKRVTSCCCPVLGATEGLDERMAMLRMLTKIS